MLQIDWRDPWLAVLLTFHIAITITALMTRNHANFQIILFLVLRKFISDQSPLITLVSSACYRKPIFVFSASGLFLGKHQRGCCNKLDVCISIQLKLVIKYLFFFPPVLIMLMVFTGFSLGSNILIRRVYSYPSFSRYLF